MYVSVINPRNLSIANIYISNDTRPEVEHWSIFVVTRPLQEDRVVSFS